MMKKPHRREEGHLIMRVDFKKFEFEDDEDLSK